ncbi:Replication-associated protein RepC [Apilactobacillus micheneri]|uniref:Replication-associated protein RepC n=1 Tax=Apilactobacillus micheneri TaxID=1899430 RepID=UPI0011261D3F|nr:Replication-associated protein RepC [Apilactobacillus micheneri]TPR47016.1 Replication-associated protein RepC [Apilactobacillus micheneri]
MSVEFKRDKNRKKKKEFKETHISQPEHTYDPENEKELIQKARQNNRRGGRPRKNKNYANVRTQKANLGKIKALQNTLGYYSQDDLLTDLLDKAENNLNNDQRTMFNMYIKAFNLLNK